MLGPVKRSPRTTVLLREIAEIALRRAGLDPALADDALLCWHSGICVRGKPGGALRDEILRAMIHLPRAPHSADPE